LIVGPQLPIQGEDAKRVGWAGSRLCPTLHHQNATPRNGLAHPLMNLVGILESNRIGKAGIGCLDRFVGNLLGQPGGLGRNGLKSQQERSRTIQKSQEVERCGRSQKTDSNHHFWKKVRRRFYKGYK
jgi:hypothetical protein